MTRNILYRKGKFLSTLSLRRATSRGLPWCALRGISIHALLAESDPLSFASCFTALLFLSTLSLRRATTTKSGTFGRSLYFYPRSPCGERPHAKLTGTLDYSISIHALLAESDHLLRSGTARDMYFYPRSPCGERLPHASRPRPIVDISIHALLAESDAIMLIRAATQRIFLSTLSLRRATNSKINVCYGDLISIHALLAESDPTGATLPTT